MKAVIMDGAPGTGTMLAFPVGNELLINHLLLMLRRHGIREVAIVSCEQDPHIREAVRQAGQSENMEVLWRTESVYRGTAGSVDAVKDFLDTPTFLGVHANVYVRELDLTAAFRLHDQYRASITLVAQRRGGTDDTLESVEIDPTGLVSRVNILHWSRNRRSQLAPCGLYVFDRSVLSHIPRDEYFDVNEQLVPLVRSRGGVVRAYEVDSGVHAITSPEDYLWLNREILLKNLQHSPRGDSPKSGLDEIVIGENAEISPHSFLLGPLVIGRNCVVEDHVHLIGPAVIGPTSYLEKGSLVRESVLRPGTRVRGNARVEYSVVGGDETVPEGMQLQSMYWTSVEPGMHESRRVAEQGSPIKMMPRSRRTQRSSTTGEGGKWGRSIYGLIKSIVDRTGAAIGLVLVGPLMILSAAAVKLDSRGPVFFSQKRCGKDGREFWMHKFRTMVPDAEQRQKDLKAKNSVDGPMFKLEEDPRVTRVGKLLRKTSLDELPQLLNVLRGEMSLVGPRPLAYDEMKFCPTWRDARLTVRPGLTGLWQVKARNRNRFSEWIRYDLEYVRRRSLVLDVYILIRTARVLLKGV
jgi:lipopolysaccharide/colanic/teichoic acid biosynthesis glycosyltransferase/ADP-glucose pyrophosphorylase